MFKCVDCGKIHDTKPNFCTCGSNVFEEIISTKKTTPHKKATTSVIPKIPPLSPQQIASICIFVLCLILAIVPWLIKIKETPIEKKEQPQVTQSTVIPDIDSFWDNTKTTVTTKQQTTAPQTKKEAASTKKTTTPQKSTQKKSTPKTTKKTNEKVTQKSPVKKVEQTQTQTQSQPQQQTKKEATIKPTLIEKPKEQPKPTVDASVMFEYKKNLNIALASKMNFLSIQGNGKCVIQFSIDQNGKLINRGFVSKSDNTSVNNEVYNMLMRLPTFTPPPKGYNGEKFKISFEINNGNYKFSYTD